MTTSTVRTDYVPPATPAEMNVYTGIAGRIRHISWGAVLAGVAISLVTMFALNMLGLSIGAATINPTTEADPAGPGFAAGTMIWLAASNLIALFAGGYVAGHMSGLFDDTDGALHGLVTWAVVTLISLFVVTTSVGSILSGAMGIASTALSAAGNVAADVAPEVADALNVQDMTWQGIQADVRNLMNGMPVAGMTGTTGSTTDTTTGTDDTGMTDTTTGDTTSGTTGTTDTTTGTTSGTMDSANTSGTTGMNGMFGTMVSSMNGQTADGTSGSSTIMGLNEVMFNRSLSNLLNADTENPADRDNVVSMLVANTGMSQAEAEAAVDRWQQSYAQVRQEAEDTARQAAETAADAIAAFAGAVFAVLVVSAFAAGMGGMAGTPERRQVNVAGATVTTP